MTTEEFAKVRDLFHRGCDLSPQARAIMLETECAGNDAIRTAVLDLWSADSNAEVLDPSDDSLSRRLLTPVEMPPLHEVGPYRVVRLLGEGGMGVCYLARQQSPDREVALKILRGHAATRSGGARFAREVRVLGRLSHPGIARIHEAGTAQTGHGVVSYYAMEYVGGARITDYAREKGLSARDKAELVAKVADAVQHAHTQGIIHRDLKPANILMREPVTVAGTGTRAAGPQPVVLDFGVAHVLDTQVGATQLTEAGMVIGTLMYTSPEHVAGDNSCVDARTDVYSMGVLLYELLTGRTPFDLQSKALPEAARIIRDEEPAPIRGPANRFGHAVDADLCTIVSHAMAKDRERRYTTAAALAEDLRRYIANEPILSRPATLSYQFAKFARRHRGLVVGAGIAVAALIAGLVVSTGMYQGAERQRRRADAEQRITNSIQDYMIDDVLKAASPDRLGEDATLVEVLLNARSGLRDRFADQPEIEARIRATLADVLAENGLSGEAAEEWATAIALFEESRGPDAAETIRGMIGHARALSQLKKFRSAAEIAEQALARVRRAHPDDTDLLVRALEAAAQGLQGRASFGRALSYEREASTLLKQSGAPEASVLNALSTMRTCARRMGDAEQAKAINDEILTRIDGLDPTSPDVASALFGVMISEGPSGDPAQQVALADRLAPVLETSVKPPKRGQFYGHLAGVYSRAGRYGDAERMAMRSYEAYAKLFPSGDGANEQAARRLVNIYVAWSGHADALREWAVRDAAWHLMVARGTRGASAETRMAVLTRALSNSDWPATRGDLLDKVGERLDEFAPPGHARRSNLLANLALLEVQRGNTERAKALLAQARSARPDAVQQQFADDAIARTEALLTAPPENGDHP